MIKAFKIVLVVAISVIMSAMFLFVIPLPARYIVAFILGFLALAFSISLPNKEKTLLFFFIFCLPFNPGLRIVDINVNNSDLPFQLFVYSSDIMIACLLFIMISNYIFSHSKNNLGFIYKTLKPLILFLGIGALGVIFAIDKRLTMIALVNYARPVFIAIIIYHICKSAKEVKYLINCLIITFAFQSILVILQFLTGSMLLTVNTISYEKDLVGGMFRPGGTLGHSSNFAKYAGMILPILIAWAITERKKVMRFAVFLIWLLGSIALVLTVSRIGIISWAIGIMIVIFGLRRMRLVRTRGMLVIAFVIMVGLAVMMAIGGRNYKERMTNDYTSMSVRIPMFKVALNVIKSQPMLGVGLNNYTLAAPPYDNTGIMRILPTNVHNLYLLLAAETGIIGLSLFLWFFIKIFKMCLLYTTKGCQDVYLISLTLGIFAGLVSILIQSLTGMGFTQQVVHLSLVAIYAVCITRIYAGDADLLSHSKNDK